MRKPLDPQAQCIPSSLLHRITGPHACAYATSGPAPRLTSGLTCSPAPIAEDEPFQFISAEEAEAFNRSLSEELEGRSTSTSTSSSSPPAPAAPGHAYGLSSRSSGSSHAPHAQVAREPQGPRSSAAAVRTPTSTDDAEPAFESKLEQVPQRKKRIRLMSEEEEPSIEDGSGDHDRPPVRVQSASSSSSTSSSKRKKASATASLAPSEHQQRAHSHRVKAALHKRAADASLAAAEEVEALGDLVHDRV